MQRQSLGSPSSKLAKDELLPSQSSASIQGQLYNKDEEEDDLIKKLNPKTTSPQTYIHLIPILTLFCFLILYLSSHDPSLTDLAEFNGVKALSDPNVSHENNISELQRILDIGKGDLLTARSLKNLKQEAKHHRLHRKIAHF